MSNLISVLLVLVAVGALLFAIFRAWGKERRRLRIQFIQRASFPAGAHCKLRETWPHLTAVQEELVAAALRDYFRIALQAQRRVVAMPSEAVDVLWHGSSPPPMTTTGSARRRSGITCITCRTRRWAIPSV